MNTILPPEGEMFETRDHPYTGDDQMDRVMGELRSLSDELKKTFPRIIAAGSIVAALRGDINALDHSLYVNGKSNLTLLTDIQRAAESVALSCERVRVLLDAERSAAEREPKFDHLVRGADAADHGDIPPTP